MKEIADIIRAYNNSKKADEKVALATVVHVEGSSYRRPGARMLVTEKGLMTGAISGGCLEGDALRKALNAIAQQKNKIVTYDTTDDDVTFGVQLGCNGIVHILFEPIDFSNPNNAVELLQLSLIARRQPVVLCTLFSLNSAEEQIGTALLVTPANIYSNLSAAHLSVTDQLLEDSKIALQQNLSCIRQYTLPDGRMYDGFIEVIEPAVSLVIAGAGNDAIPVVVAAKNLGWQVVLMDGRQTHASRQRFPQADKIIVGKPAKGVPELVIDDRTAFVLMTHNYNYDMAMMELLLDKDTKYIGSLGPRKKLDRMLDELREKGISITENERAKIYGPVGLDIGAETSEEVAVSIIAEIKSVMSSRQGGSLRYKNDTIHERFDGDHLIPVYTTGPANRNAGNDEEGFGCSVGLSVE